MNTSQPESVVQEAWRPLAYVAVGDDDQRIEIASTLRQEGWAVVTSVTGYHLLQHIADSLLGEQPWCKPELLVVDAFSPGCAGVTIAAGLRELGCSAASVLLVKSAEHRARVNDDPDALIYVTDQELALQTVLEAARHRLRASDTEPEEGTEETGEQEDMVSEQKFTVFSSSRASA